MPHQDNLKTFRVAVKKYLEFISNGYLQNAQGKTVFDKTFQDFCVQASFLGIFVAWEAFLETTFIDYTLGVPSITGQQMSKYVSPIDRAHSNRILIGSQKYVDWANSETVVRLANLYLKNGEPFNTNLKSIQSHITDLKTIRNACAHLSSTTSTQLDSVASRLLGTPISGVTVTALLTATDPNGQPGETILDRYLSFLDACAENLAKGE